MKNKYNHNINLDGIIVLDKPYGISSNQALQRIKNIFGVKKGGHTGSLDPMATGVLPICLGRATSVSQYLLNADKSYCATIQLGISTDSGDSTGKVISRSPTRLLAIGDIEKILDKFHGKINQIPPMYSALKHKGTPLYKLARQGIEVKRQKREIKVYSLKLVRYSADRQTIEIKVKCSKGAYIRTLAVDISKALNCCGHLIQLRRTQCGVLTISDAYTIKTLDLCPEHLRYKKIFNTEHLFMNTPIFTITNKKEKALFFYQGRMQISHSFTGIARIYNLCNFVALGQFFSGNLIKRCLLVEDVSQYD